MFSQGKLVLGSLRLSLTPDNMEANLFLRYNVRSLGYPETFRYQPSSDWVAPNSAELPSVTVNAEQIEEPSENPDIIIDLNDGDTDYEDDGSRD